MNVERPCPPLDKDGRAPPALAREKWTSWTYKQLYDECRQVAQGFVSLGFEQFDTVNVWGFNSPEWFMACLGGILAGGKVGGIYPTDTPEAAAFKVIHSGGSIVAVDDYAKATKIAEALAGHERKDCAKVKAFVVWGEPPAKKTVEVPDLKPLQCLGWQELLDVSNSNQTLAADVDKRLKGISPGHCAALIYTSGTTGDPKAVMLSNDNIIFENKNVIGLVGSSCGYLANAEEERIVSYLPLSHVAGFLIDICGPIIGTEGKPGWTNVFFARQYDLKAGTIKDRLGVARPTMFLGVPLVWEKMADRIRAVGAAGSGAQQAIGGWAKGVAKDGSINAQVGGSGSVSCTHCLAAKILGKVKEKVGLDKLKYGMTGAAPIRVDTLEYFGSLNIGINEVYGMSETTGAATASTDEHHQWGSCGFEIPGVEVKVFKVDANINRKTECPPAPDLKATDEKYMGEICFRGRNIMMGYLANPMFGDDHVAELTNKTAETIDADGWLHSGDKGMVTQAGMFKITGRYKELIIGEGGENIAPVPIEDAVLAACDGLAAVMMIGDKRKYNTCIVTLKAVGANGETRGSDDLDAGAARLNPKVTKISEAMDDQVWIQAITSAIETANRNSKVVLNNAFKIQKFTILPWNFSEAENLLTPTKKLKRKVVETKYATMIEKMYTTEGKYIRWQG